MFKLKNLLVNSLCFLFALTAFAQNNTPVSFFNYQSVVRNDSGNPIKNENVKIDVEILPHSHDSVSVFNETHNVTTNEFGLVNLEIGSKNSLLSDLKWSDINYYLKISVNDQVMGTTQILSVPVAMHANSADTVLNKNYATKSDINAAGAAFDDLKQNLLNGGHYTVTDIDGNTYKVTQIDDQIWMAENLRVTRLNDGTPITHIPNLSTEDSLHGEWYDTWHSDSIFIDSVKAYSYTQEVDSKEERGFMYNKFLTYSNVCPAGWRIPTHEDWLALRDYVNNDSFKLKATYGWDAFGADYDVGTNDYNFNALPVDYNPPHQIKVEYLMNPISYSWGLVNIHINDGWIFIQPLLDDKPGYFSIRCIKN